jgi:hypothetical protein
MGPLWRAASFAALLYAGWMLLGGLFQPRIDWFAGARLDPRPLLYYGCLDGFTLALSAAFLCGLEGHRLHSLGLGLDPGWLRQAGAGMGWGSAVITGTFLLLVASGAAVFSSSLLALTHALPLIGFLFLAAIFEELAFRGYVLQRAAQVLGPVIAGSLSSLLFGFAHSGNPQASLLSILNTVLAGGLLAIARVRSRALWMPIGLHFGWNFFLGPVFSFPVSGYTFGRAGLSPPTPGPMWLSGGAYGPEGGAALTAILVLALPLALRLPLPVASLGTDSGVD